MPQHHPWTTSTPAQQDTPGVQQPDLVDDSLPGLHDGDTVLASQIMTLRDEVYNLWQRLGTDDLLPLTCVRAQLPLTNWLQTVDATPTTILTIPLRAGQVVWIEATATGGDVGDVNQFAARCLACAHRAVGGAILDHSFLLYQYATNPTWAMTLVPSGNDVLLQVQGALATTINWGATARFQPST
jgi:hypothetical protein